MLDLIATPALGEVRIVKMGEFHSNDFTAMITMEMGEFHSVYGDNGNSYDGNE